MAIFFLPRTAGRTSYTQDTPEYFWEEDAWEPAYEALTAYLDMPLRVDNLNTRLVRKSNNNGRFLTRSVTHGVLSL